MARNQVIRWLDGRGWLILSGGGGADTPLRAQALGRMDADGGVACISFAQSPDASERVLADLEDLGAPSGYIVDVMAEDDQTLISRLAEAGMIVVEGGASAEDVRAALLGAAVEGIRSAYMNGAVVLAEGVSATAFGAWVPASGGILNGLAWLEAALVVSGAAGQGESRLIRSVLAGHPEGIAIGVGAGSALALGPDGQVEAWGQAEVAITLGARYHG